MNYKSGTGKKGYAQIGPTKQGHPRADSWVLNVNAGELLGRATVTRIVGNTLVYVVVQDRGPFVFTPDKIKGYRGEPLKDYGITVGANVDVTVDPARHSVISVGT